MRTFARALCTGSRVDTSYGLIASPVRCQFRTRVSESQGNSATRYYAEWLTPSTTGPTLSTNDFPPGCLHLALAHRRNFCMKETWEAVSVHWQQGNYRLWVKCFMCWMPASNAGLRVSRQLRHPLSYRFSQPLGHDPSIKKRTSTSRMVSYTRHNGEPTLGRNVSPPGCIHLALLSAKYCAP